MRITKLNISTLVTFSALLLPGTVFGASREQQKHRPYGGSGAKAGNEGSHHHQSLSKRRLLRAAAFSLRFSADSWLSTASSNRSASSFFISPGAGVELGSAPGSGEGKPGPGEGLGVAPGGGVAEPGCGLGLASGEELGCGLGEGCGEGCGDGWGLGVGVGLGFCSSSALTSS